MKLKENSVFLPPRQRFSYDKKSELPLVQLAELATFTNESIEAVTDKIQNARTNVADAWRKMNPQTPEECNEFYTKTDTYIYDLFSWAHDDQLWDLLDKKITGDEVVLDYGAGIGDVAIYLAEKGCTVHAIELPNSPTRAFMMWRVYQRKLGDQIKFKFDDAKDSFDVILAIDVLEHLHFPLRYVVQLTKLLKERSSWFFCTPSFHEQGENYPMHLADNYWLEKTFPHAMQSLAFAPDFVKKEYYPIWYPLFKTVPQGAKGL